MVSKSRLTARAINLTLACIGLIAIIGGGAWWWINSQPAPIPQHLQNMGGDFTLQSADGPVALQDFRGKVVLIYFGYTHCPDACPMTMANWASAFKRLTEEERARVRGLLISIDPERDTPQTLKEYTAYFHPNIIGVTGNHEDLDKVAALYRSDYNRKHEHEHEHEGDDYIVGHMAFVYVIDPLGKVRDLLTHDSFPDEIVKSVRNALKVRL